MGRPFLWPVVGLAKQQPASHVQACAFARSVGPALLFFPSLGATKVSPAHLSSLRCDQPSLGTTELLAGFNGRLLAGQRGQGPDNTWAQVRVSLSRTTACWHPRLSLLEAARSWAARAARMRPGPDNNAMNLTNREVPGLKERRASGEPEHG